MLFGEFLTVKFMQILRAVIDSINLSLVLVENFSLKIAC